MKECHNETDYNNAPHCPKHSKVSLYTPKDDTRLKLDFDGLVVATVKNYEQLFAVHYKTTAK